MVSLGIADPPITTPHLDAICKELRSLADQRAAHEKQIEQISERIKPIKRALDQIDEKTNSLRARLKEAMDAADIKSIATAGLSAVIIVGRSMKVTDERSAVAAITELGRLSEVIRESYDLAAIKRISDGQAEPLPGTEVVETRTLRVVTS